MSEKEEFPASPVAPGETIDSAGNKAAAVMAGRLEDLQQLASRNGFNFLVYMLDIARAEAESLQHQHPRRD